MNKLIFGVLILFSMSFISAEDCFGMSANCPSGFNVNCWEDDSSYNWNCVSDGSSPSYNVAPDGNNWCDGDEVIDYNVLDCCPDDFPYLENDRCHMSPSTNSPAKNYFTELFTCTPSSTKCQDKEQFICSNHLNRETDDIVLRETYSWWGTGKRFGVCGYEECYGAESKCVGPESFNCVNNKWVKSKIKIGTCEVECLPNYSPGEFCESPKQVTEFCVDGNVETQFLIETCENYQCVPDQKVETKRVVGECDVECFKDSDCADNRTTGKYWQDKKLYFDIVSQECKDETCSDVRFPQFLDSVFETFDTDIDYEEPTPIKDFFNSILNWFKELF